MGLAVEMITFDCSDPAGLAGWWAEPFGGTTRELLADEFTAVSPTQGAPAGVPEGARPHARENPSHLDFGAANVDARCPG